MTERIYYHDSFLREFDANVVSCEREGQRWKVILDRTAFYPTSGGQPHDIGTLGDIEVLEVVDAVPDVAVPSVVAPDPGAAREVVHYTSAEIPAGPVHGKIDWDRRLDHMQQHTAQHLLSAAFIELFGFQTKSFHLGRLTSTIDLEAPAILPRHLEEAEQRTNQIIFEDREVVVRFGTAQELAEAGIRKKVEREGLLRAIDVEGFDRQPCGGTHLARTGQAGLVLIRKLERRRDSWRIEYVAGNRVLTAARSDFSILTQAASAMTCALSEVPAGIAKWSEERRALQGSAKKMEERLAKHEAHEMLGRQGTIPANGSAESPRVVSAVFDDATSNYLGLLAAKLIAESNVIALLASRAGGHVVFAQSKGAPADSSLTARDMGRLLRETIQDFGGKGGGSRDFAQGSLPNPSDTAKVIERAQALLLPK
ncbi:MAG TPA: DHHA1 domain-containing protein [Candidatus Acidoferrales bacterium]